MSSGTTSSVLPQSLKLESIIITDKTVMLSTFNQHFISSCLLFKSKMQLELDQYSDSKPQEPFNFDFNFTPIQINEAHDALKN